ncbi:MAG: hypothetical protein ACI9L9_001010 [Marivirga sp.]|jgi:hypothetical protein
MVSWQACYFTTSQMCKNKKGLSNAQTPLTSLLLASLCFINLSTIYQK